jgi:purine-binding chemotaxis protein CheW
MHDQLFASFILDRENNLEIALNAENVSEATNLSTPIKRLPASVDYLEGIMTLRDEIVPVINLKKRLGLDSHSYTDSAKVAVVSMHNHLFGLLFDDIQEVFKADPQHIIPMNNLLQSDDKIISAIIRMNRGDRTVELLDLTHLFKGKSFDVLDRIRNDIEPARAAAFTTYSRWVIFSSLGQAYGVPVKYAREIAFLSEIDDTFKSGNVEGAIQLRGKTLPVMRSRFLLEADQQRNETREDNRVLILASEECSFGMMVDEIHEILTIADDQILPVPSSGSENVSGIFPRKSGGDIMLLDMPNLVCNQIEDIKSLARLKNQEDQDPAGQNTAGRSHHLITENCYLIFAIHKNFAIELKDVQEIIESENIMRIPGATGYSNTAINLRNTIVPVINIRKFYGYPSESGKASKLIICRGQSRTIALQVDRIVTIYKQEDYHSTPSLNPQLADKKDTLDRLIEYDNEEGLKEHVLVVNMHNLIRNHLEFRDKQSTTATDTDIQSEHINT